MHRYIALIRFTEQGAKDITQSTQRADTFDAAAEKAGITIEGQYWTFGAYDGVLIIRSDNEKAVLHCLTELAAGGNVRTETLKAFTEDDFKEIVQP